MNYQGILDSWRGIDRSGLVILKETFFPNAFNPMLANLLLLFVLPVFPVYISKRYGLSPFISAVAFVGFPITYFQLYFQLQHIEVLLAVLFVVAGIECLLSGRISFWFPAVALLGFSLSIYQSMFDFCICLGGFHLLLFPERRTWRRLGVFLAGVLAAVGFYKLFNMWLTADVSKSSYLEINFLSPYSVLALILLLLLAALLAGLVRQNHLDLLCAVCLFLFLGAGLLTIGLIGVVRLRALFPTIPFVVTIAMERLYRSPFWSRFAVVGLLLSTMVTLGLQYQEYQRYQFDKALAIEIRDVIPDESYQVTFVGKLPSKSLLDGFGEPATISFFSWDPLPNQERSYAMLDLVGAHYQKGNRTISDQPSATYPDSGWLVVDDDSRQVVVSLGK